MKKKVFVLSVTASPDQFDRKFSELMGFLDAGGFQVIQVVYPGGEGYIQAIVLYEEFASGLPVDNSLTSMPNSTAVSGVKQGQ